MSSSKKNIKSPSTRSRGCRGIRSSRKTKDVSSKKITDYFRKQPPAGQRMQEKIPEEGTALKQDETALKRKYFYDENGVVMPTFEKIMADIAEYDEHKAKVLKVTRFDSSIFDKPIPSLLPPKPNQEKTLTCKHCSLEKISDHFGTHKNELKDIFNGRKYNKGHKLYQRWNSRKPNDDTNLSSLLLFSQEQIDHSLDMLKAEFDKENNKLHYFFKILLPEFLILIFMNEHKMNRDEAMLYLNKMPIDAFCSLPEY